MLLYLGSQGEHFGIGGRGIPVAAAHGIDLFFNGVVLSFVLFF